MLENESLAYWNKDILRYWNPEKGCNAIMKCWDAGLLEYRHWEMQNGIVKQ